MEDLTKDLMEHFSHETQWRPGLGLWIGSADQRFNSIEAKAETTRRRLLELEARTTKIFNLVADMEERLKDKAGGE